MSQTSYTCTGCIPIDKSIVDTYVALLSADKSVEEAEDSRQEAEGQGDYSDATQYPNTRRAKEAARQTAEANRIKNEGSDGPDSEGYSTSRIKMEIDRQSAETQRQTNEGIGATDAECAAGSRRKNESIRQANEETRQSQEEIRQAQEGTPSDEASASGSRWARYKYAEAARQTSYETDEGEASDAASATGSRWARYNKAEADRETAYDTAEASRTAGMAPLAGYYGCSTAASTAAKEVAATNYVLTNGGTIKVKFTYANSASSPTLNINSTGAKAIVYNGAAASASNTWAAGDVVEFYYDPTYNSNAGAFVGIPTVVTVSQNTSTGHTDITIGSTTTPVASVEEVSQLGQEITEITKEKNCLLGYKLQSNGTPIASEGKLASYIFDCVINPQDSVRWVFGDGVSPEDIVSGDHVNLCFYRQEGESFEWKSSSGTHNGELTFTYSYEKAYRVALSGMYSNTFSPKLYINGVLVWEAVYEDGDLARLDKEKVGNTQMENYVSGVVNLQKVYNALSLHITSTTRVETGISADVGKTYVIMLTSGIKLNSGVKVYIKDHLAAYSVTLDKLWDKAIFTPQHSGIICVEGFSSADDFYIDLSVAESSSIGETTQLSILEVIKYVKEIVNPLVKLRICGWNFGGFNNGVSPLGIPDADVDTYIPYIKELFTKMNADILVACEYPKFVDRSQTIDTYTELLEQFFPYKFINPYDGNVCVFSKYPISLQVKWQGDTGIPAYVYGEMYIGSYVVGLVGLHSYISSDAEASKAVRIAQHQDVISRMAQYDKVIVCGDLNTKSQDELDDYVDAGYILGNWGYWGQINTYYPGPDYVDNVVVKGFNLDEFERVQIDEEGYERAGVSDHYAIMGGISTLKTP